MKKEKITITKFTLLLISLLTMTFNMQSVEAEHKIIRVPTDYPTIQEAIDNANPGDIIIVSESTYAEGQINVTKSLSLLANGLVIVDGLHVGHVFYVAANDVTINGFIIKNSKHESLSNYAGIRLDFVQNCNVSNNEVANNWFGILLINSSYNTITQNNVTNNLYYGIDAHPCGVNRCFSNNLTGNLVTNNTECGILLEFSGGNTLGYNAISGSKFNFGVYGGSIQDFINDIDTSNTVDGRPIYYLTNQQNLIINPSTFPNIGYLGVVNSTNIVIKDLNLANNLQGVLFACTNSSSIINNTITNNEINIDLATVMNSDMIGNNVTNGSVCGIWIHNSSGNNIYHNNFINNTHQVYCDLINTWDDGYPSGGNYWSDHDRLIDGYSGPGQNETGNDGICDTPYAINGTNQDRYPLLGPTTANFVIETFTLEGVEIEDVEVWIDGNEITYYSPVNFTVAPGIYNVKVNPSFGRGNYIYTFQYWNDSFPDSQRNVTVSDDIALIAYYAKTTSAGCPFIYVWNGTRFVIDNNLLPNSVTSGGAEVEDYYRLEQNLVPIYEDDYSSYYSLLLNEFQQEHSYFDQVQLIVVDHDSGVSVAVSPFGEILTYQNPHAPLSAVDDQGRDQTELIQDIDESYYEGGNGSYLLLNFGVVDAENAKLVMRADRPPSKTSIHIQVLGSAENWIDVVAIIPRTYWATEIVDLSSYLPSTGEFKVRLYFTDNHKVDYVGLDTTPQAQIDVEQAALLVAYHSSDGVVTTELQTDDDVYAELAPGQQIALLFVAAAPNQTQQTFIIRVKGYYITITG